MSKNIAFIPKITKEEFENLSPRCYCPCNQLIPWNKRYKYDKYPQYIKGHQNRKKELDYKYQEFLNLDIYCKCGCGQKIIWREIYRYYPIPEYIHGHNKAMKSKKFSGEHRKKLSNAHKGQVPWIKGKHHSEDAKQKNREKHVGLRQSQETIEKRRLSNIGKHNIIHTEETKKKISIACIGGIPWNKGISLNENTKIQISKKLKGKYCGDRNPNWKGGKSFGKYCYKFNEKLKEEIRNKYNRKCFLCNIDEKDNIDKNNKTRKMTVHHINSDKEQGCNDKRWELIPLCMKCHRKTIQYQNYYMSFIRFMLKLYEIKDVWKWWS